MKLFPPGSIAVIFCAQRTSVDETGYANAATAMSELAARQPGYLGQDSSRSPDGLGITVSYWTDDDAAKDWRNNPEHAAIREQGRAKWYDCYSLHVVRIERSYDWQN